MKVRVIYEKVLEDFWASEEELRELTDDLIVELVKEDIASFLENDNWAVERLVCL